MEHDNQTIRQFLCPFGFEPPDYVWKKMHLRTVPAKAVLVLAGSNLNAIDILLQGEIHVVNSFSDGKEFGYTNERSLTLLGDWRSWIWSLSNTGLTAISYFGIMW